MSGVIAPLPTRSNSSAAAARNISGVAVYVASVGRVTYNEPFADRMPRSTPVTAPDALPNDTSRPRGARLSSDAMKVSCRRRRIRPVLFCHRSIRPLVWRRLRANSRSRVCSRAPSRVWLFRAELTVPIIVTPRWLAHWHAIRPTPPAAAWNRIVSPRLQFVSLAKQILNGKAFQQHCGRGSQLTESGNLISRSTATLVASE